MTVGGDLPQKLLGVVAAAAEHHVHRLHAGRLSRSGRHRGGGESIRQIEIQQRHREARGVHEQVRVRLKVGLEGQQRSAHRGLHVAVLSGTETLRQLSADPRQIHLAGAGPSKLAEQRVCQPGHALAAGALDGDQPHSFGGFQVGALGQLAQHVDSQRLALRQRVHHQCHTIGELAQLAPDHVSDALGHRHPLVPHPDLGHLAHPSRVDLVLQQLAQEQSVAAGQLPEPLCAALVHRPV